jgi:DNA-directed RNA polymerase specialized sigma24 family protein
LDYEPFVLMPNVCGSLWIDRTVEVVPSLVDFEEWYPKERPKLYASLLVFSGSRELASDAADEALARALQHWRRVRAMDSPEGWTYRVAINIVRRTTQRRRFEARLLPRLVTNAVAPAPPGEVWDLVRSLPDRQRMAVVLRYLADLTEPDIGTIMGVSRGTVASTLADARHSLSDLLVESDTAEKPS